MDEADAFPTGRAGRGRGPESASAISESIDENAALFHGLGKGLGRALPMLLACFLQ